MEKGPHYYRKKKKKKKKKETETASSPEQDFHPDWDRITTLYPLSCGELAINGKQILRLYVTSGVHTSRNKCTKILKK